MILNKHFIISVLVSAYFFMSCQNQDSISGPPYSAYVLQLIPLISSQQRSEAPTYKYDIGTYPSLQNLNNLSGTYYQMFQGGKLTAKYVTGSIVFAKSFEQTKNVNLRYKVVNGAASPKDYSTAAMLSAYYQFDTVMNNIQTMTGYSPSFINSKYGTIKVFFEPSIVLSGDGSTIEASGKLNAAYMPGAHQFLLYQRSSLENIPLSSNLQVIAHESGHSIWELAFDNGSSPDCDRINQEYVIRGLNEGFADLLSYTMTGSTNILKNSIDINGTSGQRNFSTITFNYDQISNGVADSSNSVCQQSFYCIGTLFANAIFKAQANLGQDQTTLSGRSIMMNLIVNALKTTKSNMLNLPTANFSDYCSPSNGDSNNTTYNGQVLGSFFQSLLTQIGTGSSQTQICSQLKNNFGTYGFPSNYRTGFTCP
ncbi:hypothetical protein [Pigmentibacter ruber]|uniref:hypothetical protein n=1 Tax=Pigmentibacter ruber TaxID=2683196 RepID=UPI00131D7A51|nr:hypothetical protein [Pigmentibacter ruber]